MRRTGVILPHALQIQELPDFARELSRLGYTDFWTGESDRADGLTPLAVVAAATDDLRLGTAVVPVFTRGRALLAQSAAALASAAPGRVTIGLGASSPWIVEGWNDREFRDPVNRVRATVRYLREAFTGEKVEGGFRLGAIPPIAPALAVGALQPRMLELAGADADGVVLTSLSAADVPRLMAHVAPARDNFLVAAWVTVCVVEDRRRFDDAFRKARRRAGRYLLTPTYARYHRWLGRGDLLDAMGSDVENAPEALIRDLVVIGSAADCRAELASFFDAGVQVVLLEVMPGVGELTATLAALAPPV